VVAGPCVSGQREAVSLQENIDDGERDALVAVVEAVTACKCKAAGRRESRQSRWRLGIGLQIDRPNERGLEVTLARRSGETALPGKVQLVRHFLGQDQAERVVDLSKVSGSG